MAWLLRLLNRFLDWLITPLWPETLPAQPQAAPDGENTPPGQDDTPEPETPAQEAPMGKPVSFPAEWGLTPLEAAYLTALKPGKVVSVDQFALLHAGRLKDPAERVRKVIGQLRRKLDPLNVEISTNWERGWELERAARQRLTTLLRGEK